MDDTGHMPGDHHRIRMCRKLVIVPDLDQGQTMLHMPRRGISPAASHFGYARAVYTRNRIDDNNAGSNSVAPESQSSVL